MSSRDALHVTCQKNSIQSLFHCSFSKQSVWLKFVLLFDFCCYYRCCIHDEIIIWIGDWSLFQWKFYSMRHMTVIFDESIKFSGNDLTLLSNNHFIALWIQCILRLHKVGIPSIFSWFLYDSNVTCPLRWITSMLVIGASKLSGYKKY